MSVFRFFAQTSPGLEEILISELRGLHIKSRLRGDISHVQFQATYSDLFRVLHESRTIESLKIQIGNEIIARSEDELAKNIAKLPWAAFLPLEDLHTYNQPKILAKSYRSNLYHEKLISTIIERQLNLLQTRRDYKSINRASSGSDFARNPSLQREIAHRKKIVDANKAAIISNRALQLAASAQTALATRQANSDQSIDADSADSMKNQLAELPSLPDIHAYLVKDRACLLMKVHLDSLHKHSIKEKVGWAPIKEGIVAGSLIAMDFKARFSKNLRIWDPFCGSGSIVLELISMVFSNRIRTKFDFFFLKNFPQDKYEEYLASPNESQLAKDNFNINDISIIASDISNEAIQYSVGNFTSSGLHHTLSQFLANKQAAAAASATTNESQVAITESETSVSSNEQQLEKKEQDGENEIEESKIFPISSGRSARVNQIESGDQATSEFEENGRTPRYDRSKDLSQLNTKGLDSLAPFYIQEQFCENRVRFIRSDFEALSRVMDLRGYTIITNLPYGIRSAEHISDAALVSAFKRFAKTIRKNLSRLADVFIYTTVHEKYHKDHFIHISNMVWRIKQKYSLGGLEIGLFELDIAASMTSHHYQVIDEVESIAAEKRMILLEKRIAAVTAVNSELQDLSDSTSHSSLKSQVDAELSSQIREIIGDRAALAKMDPKEVREFHKEEEMKSNRQRLLKAAVVEAPIIKAMSAEQSQTPRQIKSVAQRKKVEYAKALRLRDLMQKDKQVQNLNQKEVERRISLKRDRQSKDFLRSVMESVGIENKEDALVQIQDKLDEKAQKKRDLLQEKKDKANSTSSVRNKWF